MRIFVCQGDDGWYAPGGGVYLLLLPQTCPEGGRVRAVDAGSRRL